MFLDYICKRCRLPSNTTICPSCAANIVSAEVVRDYIYLHFYEFALWLAGERVEDECMREFAGDSDDFYDFCLDTEAIFDD